VRRAAAVAALLAIVAVALAPALGAGFVWDDRADVLANPAATPAGFAAALGTTNRPLLKASYALQRATTGADPLPFHAVNLLLHLAATAAVFALARRLLAAAGGAHADFAAWGAAALWALHPAAVEAVAPVIGRSALLSSALLLAAVLLATRARPPGPRAMVAVGALAFAAPLARETALVAPALLLLWQLTLGADEPRAAALRRQLPALAGAGLAALAIALSSRHRDLLAFSLAERAPLDALRANVGAIFEILGLWAAPGRVSIDPAQGADLPWSAPGTLARAALLAGVLAFALGARRRAPAAAFAAGWTLLALAPSNSIVWRLDPVAPRALYLASIGLVLLVALAAARAASALSRGRPVRAAAAAAALAALACALPLAALARSAQLRAGLWSDPAALWADAAAKNPASARPWQNLGVELLLADRLEPAEDAFRRALALAPGETRARCALDSIHIRRRTLADREREP
jgi:hypothetical protein